MSDHSIVNAVFHQEHSLLQPFSVQFNLLIVQSLPVLPGAVQPDAPSFPGCDLPVDGVFFKCASELPASQRNKDAQPGKIEDKNDRFCWLFVHFRDDMAICHAASFPDMFFKIILVALLLFVIVSLFTAFYYMIKDPSASTRVVKSLFVRVGLSLFIMTLLILGAEMGWVTPHGFGR